MAAEIRELRVMEGFTDHSKKEQKGQDVSLSDNRIEQTLLDVREAAKRLGISAKSLYAIIAKDEAFPAYRLGGVIRMDWNEVLTFLKGKRTNVR